MKRVLAVEQKAITKRAMVGISLGYPLYDEVTAAAAEEPVRGMAAFVLEVFKYGWRAYRELGSLKALKRAAPISPGPKRISEETYAEMIEALHIILERAPSAVLEELAGYLTARAGKYGEKKPKI